jgi:hypothetical protein
MSWTKTPERLGPPFDDMGGLSKDLMLLAEGRVRGRRRDELAEGKPIAKQTRLPLGRTEREPLRD